MLDIARPDLLIEKIAYDPVEKSKKESERL